MTTQQATWREYMGSDDQIAEMRGGGFITRDANGIESEFIRHCNDFVSVEAHKNYFKYQNITHYWIIPADPLREMKIRQAQTGQPVWVRTSDGSCHGWYYHDMPYTNVNWGIPNAEYSFTPWEICQPWYAD